MPERIEIPVVIHNKIIKCLSSICKYKSECANHNDSHRISDGFTPELHYENGIFSCYTHYRERSVYDYQVLPWNFLELDQGAQLFDEERKQFYGIYEV